MTQPDNTGLPPYDQPTQPSSSGLPPYGQPPPYYPPPPYGQPPPYAQPPYGYPGQPGGYSFPVPPTALAGPGRRFAGMLLSGVLVIVTLGIGYLVWAIIAWSHSTTPAKQLLGMQVVDARTGAPADFGQMVMRQFVWALVLGLGSSLTFGILVLVDACFVFSDTRQRLLDRVASTLVVRI